MQRLLILFATVAVILTSAAPAQSAFPAASPTPEDGDRAALASIVMHSVRDVQLCGLAVERSHTAAVLSFCRDSSADEARTAIDGMELATRLGATEIRLRPAPGTDELLDSLGRTSGHDFDRAFMLAQIEGRENDETAIRFSTEVAANGSVKRYEDDVLPRVVHLLDLAEGTLETISRDQP